MKKFLRETIEILKECKKIKGKNMSKNAERVGKQAKENIRRFTYRINVNEKLGRYYKEIDEYIKSVGAKLSADEKKEYRQRGIAFLRNTSQNAAERLEQMELLKNEIEEEAGKRMRGGRGRKTRKQRA